MKQTTCRSGLRVRAKRSGRKQVMSRYPIANDMWPFTKKTTYVFYSLVNAEEKYLILEKAWLLLFLREPQHAAGQRSLGWARRGRERIPQRGTGGLRGRLVHWVNKQIQRANEVIISKSLALFGSWRNRKVIRQTLLHQREYNWWPKSANESWPESGQNVTKHGYACVYQILVHFLAFPSKKKTT